LVCSGVWHWVVWYSISIIRVTVNTSRFPWNFSSHLQKLHRGTTKKTTNSLVVNQQHNFRAGSAGKHPSFDWPTTTAASVKLKYDSDLCLTAHHQCRQCNMAKPNNSIYRSPRSAQHVSYKLLPIFRSIRLQITAWGMMSCCSGGLAVMRAATWVRHLPSRQTHSATLPLARPPTHHYNRTPYHML
jgi:hypothetical protein